MSSDIWRIVHPTTNLNPNRFDPIATKNTMTTSQLRQWSFQNSQPDQWWLSLDAVTEQIPVTVSQIEELLKSGLYGTIQALHTSQAGMEHAPWIDVTQSQPTRLPGMQSPPIVAAPALTDFSHAVSPPSIQAAAAPPAISKNKETSGLGEWLLIILTILIPLVGLIIGLIRVCKKESRKDGLILLCVSVIVMIVFYFFIFSKVNI